MWIARNKDGILFVFSSDEKPYRACKSYWRTKPIKNHGKLRIDNKKFDFLTWEDEPIEVDLIIKNNDI